MTTEAFDAVLPTFALKARFRVNAGGLAAQLRAAEIPYDDVVVEENAADGPPLVAVRFVETSVDGHTAVAGLYESLTEAGLRPDEVWVDAELA